MSRKLVQENLIREWLQHFRAVSLFGEIDEILVERVRAQMLDYQNKSDDSIKLIIDCKGGELVPALKLCDLIEQVLIAPVHGIVIGNCVSAATLVLLHCDRRLASKHSQFLIHSITVSGIDITLNKVTPKLLKDLNSDNVKSIRTMKNLYQSKLNLPTAKIDKLIARGDQEYDNYLSAEEALELSLITEIFTGKVSDLRL